MLERLPYFRCAPADYLLDTMGLTQREHGAYWLLMAHYYWNGSLPATRAEIQALACAHDEDGKAAVDNVLARFFHDESGRAVHHRIERELEKLKLFFRKQSEKGKAGGLARGKKKTASPKATRINGSAHGFSEVYAAYPRHEKRAEAEKAWIKISPDDALRQRIMQAIAAQKRSAQWTKDNGAFVPHMASWLNGKRWEDEVQTTHTPANQVPHQFR